VIEVFGDFNNRDVQNRVRLGTPQNNKDLRFLGEGVPEGLAVRVSDGDYEEETVIEFDDGVWRGRVRRETGRAELK